MSKKFLSILLATVILSSSVVGISLVNANATTETKYYLFGDIHGAHYSLPDLVDKDSEINLDECNFTDNGLLTVSFAEESYVAVKDSNNNYYMTDGLQNNQSNSAILYKTSETDINDITKMLYVRAETNATFTLTENSDGTLTLSYNSYPYTKNDSRTKLLKLLELYCWDFDYTPDFWYDFYTKESYDAYLAAKQKAEKLLADENAADEELEAMINEFKTARKNLVQIAEEDSRTKLLKLLELYCWDFDCTPEFWYDFYTKESYDAYLAAKQKAEKLLTDENATDEDFKAMIEEFNNAQNNLVSVEDTKQPDITISELKSEVEMLERSFPVGSIFRNEMEFWEAIDFAQEIVAKENPTQEELNTAYYNLISTFENLELIGWNASPYMLGDCDLDDDVNVKDATKIQLLLSKLDTITYYSRADVNNDFSINVKDATMIQLYCANFTDEASCGYTGTYRISYYYNELYNL